MATAFVQRSPQVHTTMASRRVPLANNPNVANSPYRPSVAGTKRARGELDSKDPSLISQPPSKKAAVELEEVPSRRNVPSRKTGATQTSLQSKLEAAREPKTQRSVPDKSQKLIGENLETIRQWQRHYRSVFPKYTFYFENIPLEHHKLCSKQIQALGAREEKFFSKAVTHVVTTRPIPPESVAADRDANNRPSTGNEGHDTTNATNLRTINPSLLDRNGESQGQSRVKFTLEVPGLKSYQPSNDVGRTNGGTNDILYKAREMKMKIWALEKLQRMMTTMFCAETGEQPPQLRARQANRDADLHQLLQNEKLNGPADRDPAVAAKDTVPFRGFYIYIHDVDEKNKPIATRDYPKPQVKEQGKWPQLKATSCGRCPFLEDTSLHKRQQAQQKKLEAREAQAQAAPRTRATSSHKEAQDATQGPGERALSEMKNLARRPSASVIQSVDTGPSKPLDPPKGIPSKKSPTDSFPFFGSTQSTVRPTPRYAGGEPVASGVQPSNVTSAIRSQMISSTAAAPGARAGTSKELNQLKRKILEKNSNSINSNPSSYVNSVRESQNEQNNDRTMPSRAAKKKAQETMSLIKEDAALSDEQAVKMQLAARKKKTVEKELKPGYCENCREKFNDFDEHIVSRKHRKFAINSENWRELDDLLSKLERPMLDQ